MPRRPIDTIEWVGGRYPAPGRVDDGRRAPYRPDLALWIVLPGGFVVAAKVGDPPLAPDAVVAALADTLELPLPPKAQCRIRVADPEIADAVRRRFGAAIPVVVAPTPELDAVAAEMSRALTTERRAPDHGYLQRGRIPPGDVAWLFRAAADLWTVAPWRFAADDQVLALDVPALGIAGACISILGQLEQSFGFVVFASFDAYAAFADQMPDDGPPTGDIDMSGCLAALDFVRGGDLSKVRRREIKSHGWTVAAREAHPHVVCADPDGMPRPETPAEVRLVAACAEALAAFCRRHADVFDVEPAQPRTQSFDVRTPDGSMTVRLTAPHPAWQIGTSVPAPILAPVGRNDPCPCGSGRKYKKCHLDADAPPPARPTAAQVLDLDRRMVNALLRFGESRHPDLVRAAEESFVGHPGFDIPWLVFHERIGERRLVDLFLDARRHTLDPAQRAWLMAEQETRLSLWEVLDAAPGASLELRDVFTGEACFVADERVSYDVRRGDRLLARVLQQEGIAILSGVHPSTLRPSAAAKVARAVRRHLGTRARTIPDTALRLPATERVLVDAFEDACLAEFDRLQTLTLSNTDGHPLLLTVDHFVLDAADRPAVEAALANVAERLDEEGDESAETHFDLSVAGGRVAGLDRVSIAGIRVRDGALRIETNSRERADTVRSLVEAACGDRIRHRVREHTDPRALIGRGAPPKPAPPMPPEAQQLVLDFKRRHYASWPDEHLPALGGLTPREAVTRPAMRQRLALLLDDMEHAEAAMPADQRFDFGVLRATLGITHDER